MKEIVSRCGYRCDICPAYKKNITTSEDQQKTSDGWFKIYGFRIPPEEIYCDRCLTDDSDNPKLIDNNCQVRLCVLEKGIENCAYCSQYICDNLKAKIVDYNKIAAKFKEPIGKEDYECFIKPYECQAVLDKIRKILNEHKIH